MFKIEKANENDALQIAIVNVYTWKTQYTGLMPEELIDARIKNIEFSEEKIKERIKEDGNYIVVKKGNTVVGFVRYGKCDIKDYEEYGEIKALYLLEGFQGNGLGRELFVRRLSERERESGRQPRPHDRYRIPGGLYTRRNDGGRYLLRVGQCGLSDLGGDDGSRVQG